MWGGERYQRFSRPTAGFDWTHHQHVPRIQLSVDAPPEPAPINAVRPSRCPNCRCPARLEGRIVLQGHGLRLRLVVQANDDDDRSASFAWVSIRRFRCTTCGTCCSVGPPEVLPRHAYSLLAILTAWLLALSPPLGDGLDQVAVYDRQGVDRGARTPRVERGRSGVRRWRSLARWASRIPSWWPARPVVGTRWRDTAEALLIGFVAGGSGRDGLRARAVAAHASSGAVM